MKYNCDNIEKLIQSPPLGRIRVFSNSVLVDINIDGKAYSIHGDRAPEHDILTIGGVSALHSRPEVVVLYSSPNSWTPAREVRRVPA